MSNACAANGSPVSYAEIVSNVQNGSPEGLDQLYRVFHLVGGTLRRQCGYQEHEDRMHETFVVVVEAIREGKLREPEALPGYILGIARLSLCSRIGVRVRRERLQGTLRHWTVSHQGTKTPEDMLAQKERAEIMRGLLATLAEKDREVLIRFYLHEQPKEQICREMRMTDTQFRLTKSRAKQRLSRMGSDRLQRRGDAARVAA